MAGAFLGWDGMLKQQMPIGDPPKDFACKLDL